MSATPASIETPPQGHLRTGSEQERDLQAKMQHLISLQYQEQRHSHGRVESSSSIPGEFKNFGSNSNSASNSIRSLAMTRQNNNTQLSDLHTMGREDSHSTNDFPSRTPHSTVRNQSSYLGLPDVGQGTLVFSGDLRGTKYVTSAAYGLENYGDAMSPSSSSKELLQQQKQKLQKLPSSNLQSSPSSNLQSSSEKMSTTTAAAAPPTLSIPKPPTQRSPSNGRGGTAAPHPSSLGSPPPQQKYSGYGSVQGQQHHEFRYGNPDYHDPYEKTDLKHNANKSDDDDEDLDQSLFKGLQSSSSGHGRRRRQQECFCARICCLYRPFVELLRQENLHRSFCYGAIDGLLTGSGIVSAFWGLGVLTARTQWEIRLAIVALAFAACVADSLCMAMGHIWTTYIVTSNHIHERSQERQLLEQNKADAKGKLVDMLLARGMLKIDAMSLADTLEGYPDLFVSALVGDSLLSVSDEIVDDEQTDDGYPHHALDLYPVEGTGVTGSPHQQGHHLPNDPVTGYFGSSGSWNFPSYGQFNTTTSDLHDDSDSGNVRAVYRESKKEGLFMMMGFACFAVIPSLLWLIVPLWVGSPSSGSANGSSSSAATPSKSQQGHSASPSSTSDSTPIISAPSLIILFLSIIVWWLGIWKSKFVDSNWIVFGMETVAVLLVCVFSAFGVAALLVHCLGLSSENFMLPDNLTMTSANNDL